MKHTLNLDKTASPGDADDPLPRGESLAHRQTRRRTLLGWMVGIAAGAFAVSFAVPAAALKALMLEKPVIAIGDVLTYADTATGASPASRSKPLTWQWADRRNCSPWASPTTRTTCSR